MSWIWTWVSLALVTAVVLLARRMRRADNQRVHLEARLASVLEGFDAGLSVWDGAGRLIGFNRRFREFYADAPLKPGVVFEDLIRYTANRGLVDIANDDVERWVSEHVERFGQSSHEVLRTSDRKWVDIYSRTSGAGEVLLLYTDTTNVCETEATLSDRSDQLERQTRDGELVADVVVAVSGLDPLESVTGRVIELVCAWSGWPVGCAYRVTMTDGVPVLGPVLAWYETEGTTAPITDLRSVVEGATRREGEGSARRALQTQRVIWVPNVLVDPAVDDAFRTLMSGIRGACAVPVVRGDVVLTVLEFWSREQLTPDPIVTRVLETVARVVGLSLAGRPDA